MGLSTFIRTHNPFAPETPALMQCAQTTLLDGLMTLIDRLTGDGHRRPAQPTAPPPSDRVMADANLMVGNGYLQAGDYDRALDAFQNAIRRDPEFAKAYFLLGMTRACRDEHGQAIGHYSQAIALRPDQTSYYFCRARAWDALRRPHEALADYERVLQLDPGHDGARVRRRELHALCDRSTRARQHPAPTGDRTPSMERTILIEVDDLGNPLTAHTH